MDIEATESFRISNTTLDDWTKVMELFEKAKSFQKNNQVNVWGQMDEIRLKKDIENRLQYKIIQNFEILCIFTVQFTDSLIWRNRNDIPAIYLHRIVIDQKFKGQKLFEKVLNWAKRYALENNLKYIRMDTWADNSKLIGYYKSFGFEFLGNYKTGNDVNLPTQHRNQDVALMEMAV